MVNILNMYSYFFNYASRKSHENIKYFKLLSSSIDYFRLLLLSVILDGNHDAVRNKTVNVLMLF
jgi:hypothetical protein